VEGIGHVVDVLPVPVRVAVAAGTPVSIVISGVRDLIALMYEWRGGYCHCHHKSN
jgi:hypothetical protein